MKYFIKSDIVDIVVMLTVVLLCNLYSEASWTYTVVIMLSCVIWWLSFFPLFRYLGEKYVFPFIKATIIGEKHLWLKFIIVPIYMTIGMLVTGGTVALVIGMFDAVGNYLTFGYEQTSNIQVMLIVVSWVCVGFFMTFYSRVSMVHRIAKEFENKVELWQINRCILESFFIGTIIGPTAILFLGFELLAHAEKLVRCVFSYLKN